MGRPVRTAGPAAAAVTTVAMKATGTVKASGAVKTPGAAKTTAQRKQPGGAEPMALDQSFVGRSYPPTDPYEVGREKIREFAEAVGTATLRTRTPRPHVLSVTRM